MFPSEPKSKVLSVANAFAMTNASRLAYETESVFDGSAKLLNAPRFRMIDLDPAPPVFVVGNDRAIVVAIRGTKNLQDVFTDANIVSSRFGDGYVSAGILGAFRCFQYELFRTIDLFRDSNQPVFFTGHSLGAALASLSAYAYERQLPLDFCSPPTSPVSCVYAFGSPRWADGDLAFQYNLLLGPVTWRFEHQEDLIPHLPCLLHRRHVGHQVLLDNRGGMDVDPSPIFQAWSHALGISADLYRLHSGELPEFVLLRDHHIEGYCDRIAKMTNLTLDGGLAKGGVI